MPRTQTFARWMSTWAAATLLAVVASCSSGSSSVRPGSRPPTPTPFSPRSTHSSQLQVEVTESANGTSLMVHLGADVIVTLHSTYWQFSPVSRPRVLIASAPEIRGGVRSGPSGPGSGAGTVRETYHANAAGTDVITASRTTCGEALRCTPDQSSYRLTVVVR